MGANNVELLKLAQKHLGQGGAVFNRYCNSSGAWCCAFVTYMFHEGNDSPLFYGGKKVVYCPTAIKWASANLAQIPPYLALPMDIVFFDWNLNGVPNHIGFIRERKSCTEVYTIEGNTSGGIVAQKTRPYKYIQGIYRPHFPAKFDISKPLVIDGYYGYSSIAMTQKALGGIAVDGILGKATVKALQKWAGVAQDGSWGVKTSKAIQKKLGVTQDGYFGENSVKALQRWASNKVFPQPSSIVDKELSACKVQAEWMKNYKYGWESNPTITKSKKKGTCVTYVACVLQRIGILSSGQYTWHNGKGKVTHANSKMSVMYMSGTIKANKNNLKRGDILIVGDRTDTESGSHICIFNGTWSGDNPYVWDNHSAEYVRKGKSGLHTYSGNKKIIAVVRLK
jgi:hypothetical protein